MIIATRINIVAMSVGRHIVTGRQFERLDDFEQAAVIAHEMGHIFHRHALHRLWWLISFQWDNIKLRCSAQEYEADAFAKQHGHVDGLIHFLKRCKNEESLLHPSPQERILRLQA